MSRARAFDIEHVGFIGPDGALHAPLPAGAGDPELLLDLYRAMVLTRTFDAKAVALQRTGRLGTFASSLGQEAVADGADINAWATGSDVTLRLVRAAAR